MGCWGARAWEAGVGRETDGAKVQEELVLRLPYLQVPVSKQLLRGWSREGTGVR